MAYQLWTSPVTGYRRIGTKLSDVRSLFDKGITASSIFEPLKSSPADANAQEIRETLLQLDFNVVGVMESKNGQVIGYVQRSDLTSDIVRKHLKLITPEILIADSTPIPELFALFCENKFSFILNKTKIEGIVTQADLNKPPVRIYLFGLVSLLEMHLGYWVRNHYEGDSWMDNISQSRLKAANDLYKERKKRNQEIDLFECLQLGDKRDLVLRTQDLRNELSIISRKQGEKALKRAEDLRNSLAHSQLDISSGLGWDSIFNTVTWLEEFITNSDSAIERRTKDASEGFNDRLW